MMYKNTKRLLSGGLTYGQNIGNLGLKSTIKLSKIC